MDRQFGIAQLKAFNAWRDDFLIEASTLLLIAGFILGTIDVFVGGGVATSAWFKISWAVVQALAIDGLFFAVWGRVAKAEWTRANLRKNIPLVAVGCILALVAMLVNNILTYQQVNSLANSIDAIRRLGIDVQAFTTARAVLVVAVGVLVQLFCRSEQQPVHTVHQIVESEVNSEQPQLTEVNEVDEPINQLLTEGEQVNEEVNTGEHKPLTSREQIIYWLTDGKKSSTEIADLVGVSKSYVSKVKSEVK